MRVDIGGWDGVSASQFAMRPSELVVATCVELAEERQDNVAIIPAAGRPVVVSRTWQVMGSLVAILEGVGRRELEDVGLRGGVEGYQLCL